MILPDLDVRFKRFYFHGGSDMNRSFYASMDQIEKGSAKVDAVGLSYL